MFGLGPTELVIILVIALLIFGPRRLPEMGASIGKSIKEFKKSTREIADDVNISKEIDEVQKDLTVPVAEDVKKEVVSKQ